MERYQKIEKNGAVGEGTYGVVYKGLDLWTKTYVALKRIKLETEDEGIPCTTLREIAVLRQLRHPNIVELTDVVQQSWRLYLVFEFVDQDLKKEMDKHSSPLPYDTIRSYTFQMLEGIKFCHNRGIMHRDLKPQNLLVSLGGQLKIADFGLARAFVPPVRPFTHEVVTLWYRPPEILLGEKTYALPVDLWAVGAILVEMLNKRPLFPGDSEIDELFRIFRIMGTPCETNWKEGMCLPDFNRVWPMWPTLDLAKCAPSLSPSGLNLLEGLLCLDPRDRLAASEAAAHPFFEGCSLLANAAQPTAPAPASAFEHVRGHHGPGQPVADAAPGAGDAVTGKTASAFTFHRGMNNKENATGEPALKMAKGMR